MYVNRYIRVSITWLRPENGGRKSLVPSLYFIPSIYLDCDDHERVWSFPMEFKSLPNYEEPTEAIGSFLTDSSPWEKMINGTVFEVRDGPTHTIGHGKVLEVCFLDQEMEIHPWDYCTLTEGLNRFKLSSDD